MYKLYTGNALNILKNEKIPEVQCVITSPPYFRKRLYGTSNREIGNESNVDEFISKLCDVFDTIKLHQRGSIWINIGDKRDKNGLMMVPEQFAIEMRKRGWMLVDSIIWAKQVVNVDGTTIGHSMIEPAEKRFGSNAYENLYRFVKSKNAWFDHCAVRIPRVQGNRGSRYLPKESMEVETDIEGRITSNVWRIPMGQTRYKHYASFPNALVERLCVSTCPKFVCNTCNEPMTRIIEYVEYDEGRGSKRIFGKYTKNDDSSITGRQDSGSNYKPRKPITRGFSDCGHNNYGPGIVIDPFMGTGVTGEVALKTGRDFIGIDLYEKYVEITRTRLENEQKTI